MMKNWGKIHIKDNYRQQLMLKTLPFLSFESNFDKNRTGLTKWRELSLIKRWGDNHIATRTYAKSSQSSLDFNFYCRSLTLYFKEPADVKFIAI